MAHSIIYPVRIFKGFENVPIVIDKLVPQTINNAMQKAPHHKFTLFVGKITKPTIFCESTNAGICDEPPGGPEPVTVPESQPPHLTDVVISLKSKKYIACSEIYNRNNFHFHIS